MMCLLQNVFIILLSCQSAIVSVTFSLIAAVFYVYQGYLIFSVNSTKEISNAKKNDSES